MIHLSASTDLVNLFLKTITLIYNNMSMNRHFFRFVCSCHFSNRAGSDRFSIAGKRWEVSTGQLAPHADSAVIVHFGDTAVIAAIFAEFPQMNSSTKNNNKQTPLVTDYSEKPHISMDVSQNFYLRSARQFEKFSLISRSIDRTVRPLVPSLPTTLNLSCILLASDETHDPEITAINAATAALALTGTPGIPTSAAVRMGRVGGEWVVNPDRSELADSEVNYIISCTRQGISMVQGHSAEIPLSAFYEMLGLAFKHACEFITIIESLKSSICATTKFTLLENHLHAEMYSFLKEGFYDTIKDLLASSLPKLERGKRSQQLIYQMTAALQERFPDEGITSVESARTDLYKEALRENVLERDIRPGGRGSRQLRELSGSLAPLRATHGSAIFQRGETQILSSLTFLPPFFSFDLATGREMINNRSTENFSLHYSNPDYSIRDKAGVRRNLGHSRLAEGGLLHLIPSNFPLSINLSCDVQSSGGSSSMTSICAASLALMDGGVPLKTSAAGVATGLLLGKQGASPCVLSDVQGIEDALGNMDLKVGGTREGITTCQMDIKETDGIPLEIMWTCLEISWLDRLNILNYMDEMISQPRHTLKHNVPVSSVIRLKSESGSISRPGSLQKLRMLQKSLGVNFYIVGPEVIYLFAKSPAEYTHALETFHKLIMPPEEQELEFGALYRVKVVEVRPYGILVQLFSSQEEPSMIHQSQLYPTGLTSSHSIKVDDYITIKYFGREPISGRLRLSRKAAMSPYNNNNPIQFVN